MKTGEFERDMSYLLRCYDPEKDVDKFIEEQFDEYVETLRSEMDVNA